MGGAENLIHIFITSVTRGNEDAGSVQNFILSFWCESRKLGGRVSPRFPCVIPVVKRSSLELLRAIISYCAESYLQFCETSAMELPAKTSNCFKTLTISTKKHPADVKLDYKCASDLKGTVNVECRWTKSAWNLQPKIGAQGSG